MQDRILSALQSKIVLMIWLKYKLISEDSEKDGLDEVQKLTNTYISKIDELMKNKEQELMTV